VPPARAMILPETRAHAHLQALVVRDRGDLLPEPSTHLRGEPGPESRHEVERGVGLFPELGPVAVVVPDGHPVRVDAERDGREPLDRGLLGRPVVGGRHEGLDGALRRRVEALEGRHDLATGKDLDAKPSATHLVDDLGQTRGGALQHVELRGPGRGHPPLDLGLGEDLRRIDEERCRADGAGLGQESTSLHGVPTACV
jgi:hypothetical protein